MLDRGEARQFCGFQGEELTILAKQSQSQVSFEAPAHDHLVSDASSDLSDLDSSSDETDDDVDMSIRPPRLSSSSAPKTASRAMKDLVKNSANEFAAQRARGLRASSPFPAPAPNPLIPRAPVLKQATCEQIEAERKSRMVSSETRQSTHARLHRYRTYCTSHNIPPFPIAAPIVALYVYHMTFLSERRNDSVVSTLNKAREAMEGVWEGERRKALGRLEALREFLTERRRWDRERRMEAAREKEKAKAAKVAKTAKGETGNAGSGSKVRSDDPFRDSCEGQVYSGQEGPPESTKNSGKAPARSERRFARSLQVLFDPSDSSPTSLLDYNSSCAPAFQHSHLRIVQLSHPGTFPSLHRPSHHSPARPHPRRTQSFSRGFRSPLPPKQSRRTQERHRLPLTRRREVGCGVGGAGDAGTAGVAEEAAGQGCAQIWGEWVGGDLSVSARECGLLFSTAAFVYFCQSLSSDGERDAAAGFVRCFPAFHATLCRQTRQARRQTRCRWRVDSSDQRFSRALPLTLLPRRPPKGQHRAPAFSRSTEPYQAHPTSSAPRTSRKPPRSPLFLSKLLVPVYRPHPQHTRRTPPDVRLLRDGGWSVAGCWSTAGGAGCSGHASWRAGAEASRGHVREWDPSAVAV